MALASACFLQLNMGTNVLGSLPSDAPCYNHAPPLHTVYSLIPLACSQQILSCRGGQRACACCKLGNLSLRLRARHAKVCYRTRGYRGVGQIALVSVLGNADWCREPNFCGERQHRKSSGAAGRGKSTVVHSEGKNGVGNKSVLAVGSENGGAIHKEKADDLLVGGDGDTTDHVATTEVEGDDKDFQVLHLKELLRLAHLDLEKARIDSTQVETEAQKVAETAIALRDEAAAAISAAESAKSLLQSQLLQESSAKEALEKSKLVLCAVKARLKSIEETVEDVRSKPETGNAKLEATVLNVETELGNASLVETKVEVIASEPLTKEQQAAQLDLQSCEETLKNFEIEILRIQNSKLELQKEVARLSELADAAKAIALAADEDVANAMSLAEKAVALEVEAAQRLSDAEIALQKAESQFGDAHSSIEAAEVVISPASRVVDVLPLEEKRRQEVVDGKQTEDPLVVEHADGPCSRAEDLLPVMMEEKCTDKDLSATFNDVVDTSINFEKKAKEILDNKMPDSEPVEVLAGAYSRKSEGKDTGDSGTPKSFTKKSSRFFPASFFSFDEGEEFSPSSVFTGFLSTVRQHFPKVVVGGLLLLGGGVYLGGKVEKLKHVVQSYEITTNIEEVATTTKPLIKKLYRLPSRIKMQLDKLSPQEVNEEEASLFDVLWLLLASVVFVPIFQKIPGGSPVLGYLAAGILIGPHSLHIIRNVHGTKAIAEFGVVFLLFNIGLELSVERLSSMRKYVFGFGSGQVLATALAAGLFAHYVSGLSVPAAIVIGNGLALSSTAVVLQVLQERGESTSRHGRAAFSVLLFQDLAVVVLLILIPLISPNSSKGGVGFNAIAEALGIAAIKGVIAISGIIAGGRLLLRPIYRSMAENHNAEIFAANTLLVVLGTSVFTARAGLSMALGAFLAGLLLSETEFALQVESDIAPYRGLLLGLFFMTVGMSIDPQLFVARFPVIMGALALLIGGKTLLIASLGRQFGLSSVAAVRTGLLLAPGGEFAFVAFGEAVNQGIMSQQLSSLMFLVVGLSMAITPWLAAAGQVMASKFEQQDVRSLLPAENETDDLQGHIIVCGFGRVGQIISQMLSERLIPFVALDVRSERVSMGRTLDLPVYFGDAGSREVLHKLGAERAAAAVITLDTPGANYRAVWALSKYFPKVKTYVRAHDVDHGINLEKAGATAVVPETLEPSLQLAAAVLAEAKLPASEIGATINEFRSRHLAELTELTKASGTSLGYGYFQTVAAKQAGVEAGKGKIDEDGTADRRFEGVVAVP